MTVTNYLADLRAFARWFEQTNGDALSPDRVTPTDLREFKQHTGSAGSETRQHQPETRYPQKLFEVGHGRGPNNRRGGHEDA